MHVNLPLNKVDTPATKPTAAPAGKPQPGNFGDLLKNAQAAAGTSPTSPAAPL